MQNYINSLQNDLKEEREAKIDPLVKAQRGKVAELKVESELMQELKKELQACRDAITQKEREIGELREHVISDQF